MCIAPHVCDHNANEMGEANRRIALRLSGCIVCVCTIIVCVCVCICESGKRVRYYTMPKHLTLSIEPPYTVCSFTESECVLFNSTSVYVINERKRTSWIWYLCIFVRLGVSRNGHRIVYSVHAVQVHLFRFDSVIPLRSVRTERF